MSRRRTAGRRPAWPGAQATKRQKRGRAYGSEPGSSCRRDNEVDDDDAVEPRLDSSGSVLDQVGRGERSSARLMRLPLNVIFAVDSLKTQVSCGPLRRAIPAGSTARCLARGGRARRDRERDQVLEVLEVE